MQQQNERTPLRAESKGWNYSRPDAEGYLEAIEGTVVEFSKPQHTNYSTKEPEFWPSGDPKLDWCLTLRGRTGKELNWRFSPGSATRPKIPRVALTEAIESFGGTCVEDILGKFIRVATEEGTYNMQHPRPWTVTVLGDGQQQYVRGSVPPATVPNQFELTQQGAAAARAAINQQPAQPAPPADDTALYEDDIPF